MDSINLGLIFIIWILFDLVDHYISSYIIVAVGFMQCVAVNCKTESSLLGLCRIEDHYCRPFSFSLEALPSSIFSGRSQTVLSWLGTMPAPLFPSRPTLLTLEKSQGMAVVCIPHTPFPQNLSWRHPIHRHLGNSMA